MTTYRREPSLRGVFCPIVTPFDDDGALDEDALRRQVDRVVDVGDGVMVLGSSGELPILPSEVADRVLEIVAEHVAGRATLVCGIAAVGTAQAVDGVAQARRHGADLVAVTAPFYYPVGEDGLVRHYREIADISELPVVLYNIPVNTHRPLTIPVVEELASHPRIVGIKDSGGDRAFLRDLLELRAETGLSVLQGTDEAHASEHWRSGVDGYVSGLENLAPGSMKALAEALSAGDADGARAAQGTISEIAHLTQDEFWLSVLKEGVAMQGIGSGLVSRPLPALSVAGRARLRDTLVRNGLLVDTVLHLPG